MGLVVQRAAAAFGCVSICVGLGVLLPACSGGGGGGGAVVVTAAPIGDIAGGWVVSILPKKNECNPEDVLVAELIVLQVLQNGNTIEIVAEDGSPIPEVEGGSVKGTLVGDQLSFSFTINETDGDKHYEGTVTVGHNLRSFYSADETCIRWSFVHDTDPKLNCAGEEVWTGQLVDIVHAATPDLAIPAEGQVTTSITIADDATIGDIEVHAEISDPWGSKLTLEVSSPGATRVTLQSEPAYNAVNVDFVTGLNIIWSDTGRPFGLLPPRPSGPVGKGLVSDSGLSGSIGCEMRPSGPGTLEDFSGESTLGDWTLKATDTFDSGHTLRRWGLLVNLVPSRPNIAGDWLLRITTVKDGCAEGALAPSRLLSVRIEQDGSAVTIRQSDGSPLEDVVGGTITGTLSGTRLPVSFVTEQPDGRTQNSGTVDFSDFLNGFRPRRLDAGNGITWEFTPTGATEPLCSGIELWSGRPLPLSWEPEVIACGGPEALPSKSPHVISVEEDQTIGEAMVVVDVTQSFINQITTIVLRAPDETSVTLFDPTQLIQDTLRFRLDVTWADRGANYGDFPPIDSAAFGGQMEPAGPGELADFAGGSTQGEWTLDIITFDGATLNQWCLLVNDDPPPPPHVVTVCADGPAAYVRVGEPAATVTDEIVVMDDFEIDAVEIATDVQQLDIQLLILTLTSPDGTQVALKGDDKAGGAAPDLDVIWSEKGLPYGQFPEGNTTFGGLMQPAGLGALESLEGERSAGTWQVHIESFNSGTLNDWCVMVQESD